MATNQIVKTNSYLLFKIGEEAFAANVSKVECILELTKITKIPRTHKYIRGVINLRGSVLPIVDIKLKFGLEQTQYISNTCILVIDVQLGDLPVKIGALVDNVLEVIEINEEDILPAPNIGKQFHSDFITGMYNGSDNSFIMLLDMDLVFSTKEISYMSSELLFDEENNQSADEEV